MCHVISTEWISFVLDLGREDINSIISIGTLLDLSESVLPRVPCFEEKLSLAQHIWIIVVESDLFIPLLSYKIA